MKKSFTFLKVSYIDMLLSVMSISEGFAQGLRTSYFMDNVPSRLKMNPALQPARGYFNIPAIGAIGLSASSNKLSIDDFIDIIQNKNSFLNSDQFINRLDNKNTMNIDLTLDLISFGIYSGKGFWTVNLGARSIISASIPKSMFELARYANTNPELDENVNLNYDIKDMELHANIFTEIGLGYSRPVTKDLTVGGRVKLLVGLGNLDAKIDQIYAHVNTDDLASYQSWKVKTKGRLEASMKGLEFSYNSDSGYIDDIDFDSPGISGYGLGLDLGASYNLFGCINLSAAIIDLGFINWTKSSTTIATTNSEHDYGDFANSGSDEYDPDNTEAGDVFDFDLIQFQTEENAKSRSTSLRSTLNLGAEYTLLNNKLGFGLLSSTQFTQPEAYSELTISANYRPKNWFGVSLSYSFLHSDFETLGIGLKLGSIFIGSDYLMTKSLGDANRANVYLGVSVPLGKKRQDYRRK